jgi:predicted nucleotidyltransferase
MPHTLPDGFLETLLAKLDEEDVVGIMLGGSYARGAATPYSDVDLAVFLREGVKPRPKQYLYKDGLLVSVKYTTVEEMQSALANPLASMLSAAGPLRPLLDKDGSLARLARDREAFQWEPLRSAAERYVSMGMTLMVEWMHKLLSEFFKGNEPGLARATERLASWMPELVAIRYGVLVTSDSTYYQQVYETVGVDAPWTRHHRIAAGIDDGPEGVKPVRARAWAALDLYRETVALVGQVIQPEHRELVEESLRVMDGAVPKLLEEGNSTWRKR